MEDADVAPIQQVDGHRGGHRGWRQSFHVCVPVACRLGTTVEGQLWLILGPVICYDDIQPRHFTFAVRVRASSELTGREVFARAVSKLVARGYFRSRVAAHETLRFLARVPSMSSATGVQKEPSWCNLPLNNVLTEDECRLILRRADKAVTSSGGVVLAGNVTVGESEAVCDHAWVKYDAHLRDLRAANTAVENFRSANSFAAMSPERQRGMLGSSNAATLTRMRTWTELEPRARPWAAKAASLATGPAESVGAAGAAAAGVFEVAPSMTAEAVRARARRRQMPGGKSACKTFPSKRDAARIRREAVDAPERPSHAMITRGEGGRLRVWHYVVGSATNGVRRYRLQDGTSKRLAAPHLRRLACVTPCAPHQQSSGNGAAAGAVADADDGLPRAHPDDRALTGAADELPRRDADIAGEIVGGAGPAAAEELPRGPGSPDGGSVAGAADELPLGDADPDDGGAAAATNELSSDNAHVEGGAVATDDLPRGDRDSESFDLDLLLSQLQGQAGHQDEQETGVCLEDVPGPPLQAERGSQEADRPDQPPRSKMSSCRISKATFLENDNGTGREVVVAVEFNAVESLALAFRSGAESPSDDLSGVHVELTLAGDGGPVLRTTLTVFTLTVSTSLFPCGASPLIPVLFLLSGEQAIHSAVGDRLREQLHTALAAEYAVPVVCPCEDDALPSKEETMPITAVLRLPFFLRLCGDFAMLDHFLSLTGGSDKQRCPCWWPCTPRRYLSGAFWLASPSGQVRNPGVLCHHWLLVVWSLARWCALLRGHWVESRGRLTSMCACGSRSVACSSSPALLSCKNLRCSIRKDQGAHVLPHIAYSPLSDMYKLLRRLLGGTRGYPLLGNIPFLVQPPVLHCTGKIAKNLVWFLFSLLPASLKVTARMNIFSIMGRSNMKSMYLREFCRLSAHVVADPQALGVPLDGGVIMMLQLSQLLTAAWRRAIGTSSAHERECAAVTLQLTATVLASLYAVLKHSDPDTKSSGVYNLYLHTAMAHVRSTVGHAFPTARYICDDNIEGMIASLNQYFRSRTNNVSRGESLVNKQAMNPITFTQALGREAAEQRIFTEKLTICPCVYRLASSVRDDVAAVVEFAKTEPNLSVSGVVPHASALPSATPLSFDLPTAMLDRPKANPNPMYEDSADVELQALLQAAQRHLVVCWCGKMSGRLSSAVCLAAIRASRAAAAAAAAHAEETAQEAMAVGHTPGATQAAQPSWQGAVPVATADTAPAPSSATVGRARMSREDAQQVRAAASHEEELEAAATEDREEYEDDDGQPIEGLRTYNFIDNMSDDSDDDDDDVGSAPPGHPVSPIAGHPSSFLLQCALRNEHASPFLASEALVDAVFTPVPDLPDAARAALLPFRDEMQQNSMMLRMFVSRLATPTFTRWMEKDGVLRQDLLRAADTLTSLMIHRVAATADGGTSA